MGFIKILEKKFLLENYNLRQKLSSYSIGDTLEVGYITFGDSRSIRRFKGILITKIKRSEALMQRIILMKRVKGVSVKFAIDLNNPKFVNINLVNKNSLLIRKSRYTYLKNYF